MCRIGGPLSATFNSTYDIIVVRFCLFGVVVGGGGGGGGGGVVVVVAVAVAVVVYRCRCCCCCLSVHQVLTVRSPC